MSISKLGLSLVLLSSVVACGGSVNPIGFPEPLEREDICGSSDSCGMSGVVVWAKGDIPLMTGDPKNSVGVLDDHERKRWLFDTPDVCAYSGDLAESVTESVPSESRIRISAETRRKFEAGLKAELTKQLKDVAEAKLEAGIKSAFDSQTNGQLTVSPHLFDLADDAYRQLKKSCQNSSSGKYVRKQLLVLSISGESKKKIKESLSASLSADARMAGAAEQASPVDVGGNAKAEVSKSVDKAVETTIAHKYYLLGVSFQN